MYKLFGFKSNSEKHVGVFYCNDMCSCEELVIDYNINIGIVLDEENTQVGVLFNNINNETFNYFSTDESIVGYIYKDSSTSINIAPINKGIKGCVSHSRYHICGVCEEDINIPFYVSLEDLDEVHTFLEDKEVPFGFIIEDGELEYLIDEGSLLNRKYF